MLTGPRLVKNAKWAFDYFMQEYLARNDGELDSTNHWYGKVAAVLQFGPQINESEFLAAFSGQIPKANINLGRIIDGQRRHLCGYELIFSAPKSISLEALYLRRHEVLQAHDNAVCATLDYIGNNFLRTRGYDPETRRRPRRLANGLVVALFRHTTNRNNDPHLHTHALVANITRNPDGVWRTVEPTLLRRNRRLFGSWYRNDLARRLLELGYELTPTMIRDLPGFEITGWSSEWLRVFSSRRKDILQYLDDNDLSYTTANAQWATLITRKRKAKEPLTGELLKIWHLTAEQCSLVRDLDRYSPAQTIPKIPIMPPTDGHQSLLPPGAVWDAKDEIEGRRSCFRQGDLLAASLGRNPGRHTHIQLENSISYLLRLGKLIVINSDIYSDDLALTTDDSKEAEQDLIKALQRERSLPLTHAGDVIAKLNETSLTDGQKDAVRTILCSQNQIVGVLGFAGEGKSQMLKEVVRLADHRPVIGLASASEAVRVLRLKTGIHAVSVKWLLTRYGLCSADSALGALAEQFRGAILIFDEASIIGAVPLQELQWVATRLAIARLVLMGDRILMRRTEARQPFRLLQDVGMEVAFIDDVLRQRALNLKSAFSYLLAQDADLAVQSPDADLIELPSDRLEETAGRLWLALPPLERARTVILAPSPDQQDAITAVLRDGLADEGVLTGRVFEIERLVNRRLTPTLAADHINYQIGDIVEANRDVYGCAEGEAWRVTASHPKWITLERQGVQGGFKPSGAAARSVSVFEPRPISLRAGDAIEFTRHLKTLEIVSGERGKIEAIENECVHILLEDGRRFTPRLAADWLRHINHAWTTNVEHICGKMADAVIAVLDADSMINDLIPLYVEMSLSHDDFILLTDDLERLRHRLEHDTGISRSVLKEIGQSLDVASSDHIWEEQPLQPVLEEWQVLEIIAERKDITPLQLPEAVPLLNRFSHRAKREGEDTPVTIRHILATYEGYGSALDRRIDVVDTLGKDWAALRAKALEKDRRVGAEKGVGALLARSCEELPTTPQPKPLPEALVEGIQDCRVQLQALSSRFEDSQHKFDLALERREAEKSEIEREWVDHRIKAESSGCDIAFLPGAESLVDKTMAFDARHPDILRTTTVVDAVDCAALLRRETRLKELAKELIQYVKTEPRPAFRDTADGKLERILTTAEALLVDERLSQLEIASIFRHARYRREIVTAQDASQRRSGGVEIISRTDESQREEIRPKLAAEQQTDPRDDIFIDDLALQLAIAVSERVDSSHAAHGRDLVHDIGQLLREAKVTDLPQDKVASFTKLLYEARVTYDTKRAFAEVVVRFDPRGDRCRRVHEQYFKIALAGRRDFHPLQFSHRTVRDAFDRRVDEIVRRALAERPAEMRAEQAVARAAVLPALSAKDRDLVNALAVVFEGGSLRDVNSLRDERDNLLASLRDGDVPSDGSTVRRLFRAFTHREISALVSPAETCPGSLPSISDNDRVHISYNLASAIPASYRQSIYEPWHEVEEQLQNKVHPELAKEGRGMGLGL